MPKNGRFDMGALWDSFIRRREGDTRRSHARNPTFHNPNGLILRTHQKGGVIFREQKPVARCKCSEAGSACKLLAFRRQRL